MRVALLTFLLVAFANTARAECGPSATGTYFSCALQGGGEIDLCFENDTLVLREAGYELASPIGALRYYPWGGYSMFNESVGFSEGAFSRVISIGETRIYGPETETDPGTLSSVFWANVETVENWRAQDEKFLTSTACIADSIVFSFDDALRKAKNRAGLCWDQSVWAWIACGGEQTD